MENYVGPYWSDGKWQESVEFGNAPTLSGVDAASRLHDSAYAHFTDEAHRIAADEIYSATLKRLKEPLSALADVPLYGNYIKNRASELGSDVLSGFKYGGPIGAFGALVYNGIKGIVRSNDLIQNGGTYRDEVLDYYATDPLKPIVGQKIDKISPLVSIPKTIAPLQTHNSEEMFKKNKIAPLQATGKNGTRFVPLSSVEATIAPTGRNVSVAPQPALTPLYRPLKKKRKRPISAAGLLKWLEYHPGQEAKVASWLIKHPLQ